MNRFLKRARLWIPLSAFVLMPLPAQLVALETTKIAELVLTFVLLAGAGMLVSLGPRQVTVVAGIILLVLVAVFHAGSPGSASGWSLSADDSDVEPQAGSSILIVTRDGPTSLQRRLWVPYTREAVTIVVDAVQGDGGVARPAFYGSGGWEPVNSDYVIFRSQPGTYVYMSHDIDGDATGRSYMARVDLRSHDGVEACGFFVMLVQGHRPQRSLPICVSGDWSTFELSWEVPHHEGPRVLDVVLTGFGAANVAVRSMQAWEVIDGRAAQPVSLRPTEFSAVAIARAIFGESGASSLPRVGEGITRPVPLAFVLEPSPSIWGRLVDVRVSVPPNRQMFIGGIASFTDGGTRVRGAFTVPVALASTERRRFHFAHPNLAGHSIAAVSVAVAAVGLPGLYGISVVIGLSMLGAATGSRIAIAVSLLAVATLVARTAWSPRRRVHPAALLAVVAAALVLIPFIAGRDARIGSTPRSDVWNVALLGIADSPLTGQTLSFRAYADTLGVGRRAERVSHAHNLWLEQGFRYGVLAVVGILLLFAALVYRFVVQQRWVQGLGVCLVAGLQVFDVSLFYAPVTIAFAVLVNGSSHDLEVPGGSSTVHDEDN